MEGTWKKFGQCVLEELECPVCWEYMQPPITMCRNGHNICNRCKPKLNTCPTCKGKLLTIRNLALENLAAEVPKPCRNDSFGCKKILSPNLIEKHENNCCFFPYRCPIRGGGKGQCPWVGSLDDMKNHLKKEHENKLHELSDSCSKNFLVLRKNAFVEHVLCAMNAMFYRRIDVRSKNVFCYLQYVGPKHCVSNYTCKMSFEKIGSDDKITSYNKILWYMEESDEIYKSKECFKISFPVLQKLLDKESKLRTEFKITKIN